MRVEPPPLPWPETSPISATDMPPGVLRIPMRERVDFLLHVTLRYARQIATYWPVAAAKALRTKYPEFVSDAELCSLLYDTSMARLLCTTLDEIDRRRFASHLIDGRTYLKADFSAYAQLATKRGMHAAPTVTLFERDGTGRPQLRAIALNDEVFEPAHGDAWTLAKAFVLQGAGHHMVNCHHIPLHFPLDTVNAVSKSVLPRDHVVSRLLAPHLRFSLSLNGAALYSSVSILRNHEAFIYSPFAIDEASVYKLVCIGYAGIAGNSAYPQWRYSPVPEPIVGDYGVFLDRYYDAILEFTRVVAATVKKGDAHIAKWADAIAGFLRGFPDASQIHDGDLLARVLAKHIWSATVAHAADHYDYGCIPIARIPMRLRVPPPSHATRGASSAKAGRWTDAMRHEMARVLFFKDDTITRLIDVRYDFATPKLDDAGVAFVKRLHDVDAEMPVRRFIPLKTIPVSIQF